MCIKYFGGKKTHLPHLNCKNIVLSFRLDIWWKTSSELCIQVLFWPINLHNQNSLYFSCNHNFEMQTDVS